MRLKKVQRSRMAVLFEAGNTLSVRTERLDTSVIITLFSRDEAEMNYLKIAQDLEMYGVNYFPIAVSAVFEQFAIAAGDGSAVLKSFRQSGAGIPEFCCSLLCGGSVATVLFWFALVCLPADRVGGYNSKGSAL